MDDIIIGKNSVYEALEGGRSFQKIYMLAGRKNGGLKEIYDKAKRKGIPIQEVSEQALQKIAGPGRHQGVAGAVAPIRFWEMEEVLEAAFAKTDSPVLVLLDGIEDVHNAGAIIRTAECAGADGILLPKRHAVPMNQTVAKTSAGALEHMPIVQIGNIVQELKKLKKLGFWVVGTDMDGEIEYYDASLKEPTVIVIGSEGKGMSRLTRENCDMLVRIPMFGRVNSLNASVAAALILYETVRQRRQK